MATLGLSAAALHDPLSAMHGNGHCRSQNTSILHSKHDPHSTNVLRVKMYLDPYSKSHLVTFAPQYLSTHWRPAKACVRVLR